MKMHDKTFVEGVINRTVMAKVLEFKETKKSKETQEEFAIVKCEDRETDEQFNLIMSLEAFAELKEGDFLYLKYFYVKHDDYDPNHIMVLSKGKHGQIVMVSRLKKFEE